jgi:hypothetical protein
MFHDFVEKRAELHPAESKALNGNLHTCIPIANLSIARRSREVWQRRSAILESGTAAACDLDASPLDLAIKTEFGSGRQEPAPQVGLPSDLESVHASSRNARNEGDTYFNLSKVSFALCPERASKPDDFKPVIYGSPFCRNFRNLFLTLSGSRLVTI